MLSSNMAASVATEINIHLCKHLFYIIVRNGFSMNSPFVVQAHDDCVRGLCALLPWICPRLDIQVSLMAMLEDSMTSLKTLYLANWKFNFCT